jgi:hypothetical protein
MAIILSHPMNAQEIRVLQEYRRIGTETLAVSAIKSIKHPVGGGETPAVSLVQKGYLAANGENFVLTQKGKDFLLLDVKPEFEGAAGGESAAE